MAVELIGMIHHRLASEIHAPSGPAFDREYIRDIARAHEDGGFDRVLVGYFSTAPDGFLVAALAAASTERLGLLLAHRPGFVAPTLAARKLATLDQLSGGRLALHVISGGDDRMWPASHMSRMLVDRARRFGREHLVRHLDFPEAGHALFAVDAAAELEQPIPFDLGGSESAQASSHAAAWPQVLRVLLEGKSS